MIKTGTRLTEAGDRAGLPAGSVFFKEVVRLGCICKGAPGRFFYKKVKAASKLLFKFASALRHRFGTYRGQCRKGVKYEDAIIGAGT